MRYTIRGRSIKESFDNLPAGVCFADSNGIIVLCNRQMHRLGQVLLGAGVQHIFELRKALKEPKNDVSFVSGKAGILRFPDGHVWEFRETAIRTASGKSYTQMQALSLTELYAKKAELEQKNRELEGINKRAKQLYATLDKTVREEEVFAIKMRTAIYDCGFCLRIKFCVMAGFMRFGRRGKCGRALFTCLMLWTSVHRRIRMSTEKTGATPEGNYTRFLLPPRESV